MTVLDFPELGYAEPVAPDWDAEAPEPLRCVQVQQITHDVRTFVLEPMLPCGFRHEPGQFMVISLVIDGATVERCYTITSPPTRSRRIAFTVKRQPGGLVSNWLHDNLAPGMEIRASGPLGTFSPSRHPSSRYLFLSGGSGATPMMVAMRTFFDLAEPVDLAYVHSARSPRDILFRDELEMMSNGLLGRPATAISHICEEDSETEIWHGPRGRISADLLAELVPDVTSRTVFACGPGPYLKAVRAIVADLGVAAADYHEESFVLAPVAPAELPVAAPSVSTTTHRVEFAKSGRVVDCELGATVLMAADRAGVRIPSSCGQGLCGTCKVTRLSGDVEISHQGGIRPKEIKAGRLLACCAVPTSNVVIDA